MSITRNAAAAAVIFSLGIAACGGTHAVGTPAQAVGTPAQAVGTAARAVGTAAATVSRGGTAYFAEQPLSPPDYIFPLVSDENYSVANTAEFQTLLYRPLYWYGDDRRPGVDYPLSLGDAPLYGDDNRTVTITLKRARWSDGEAVSARDVGFWINLLKANKDDWASYVPGGFPDNVVSWRALGTRTIVLRLMFTALSLRRHDPDQV